MSSTAVIWALHAAPARTPSQRLVLVYLAEHADGEGRGTFPAVGTIRLHLGMSERTVRQYLAELEADKVIIRGDQSLTGYLRSDQRPVVWDLALEVLRTDIPEEIRDGRSPRAARTPRRKKAHGVQPTAPRVAERGAAHDTPSAPDGVQPTAPRMRWATAQRGAVQRVNGVQPTAPEPSTEPTTKNSLPPVVSSPTGARHENAQSAATVVATSAGNELLAEHLAACRPQPPRRVTQRTGAEIDELVREGLPPDRIRAGLALLRSKPHLGPALLPQLVHEAASRAALGPVAPPGRERNVDALARARANLRGERPDLTIIEGELA